MIDIFPVTLPRLTGHQQRRAYVYVPDAAQDHPEKRYPVLYMFDGHNVFFDSDATYGKSWGMKDYLERTDTPLIVAAVECNHNPNNGRLSEYAPFTFQAEGLGRIHGRGKLTMAWMIEKFKPYVDAHYPTLPMREATFIGGSSMGGLMSLYAVLCYNQVFSRAAALSPSLWVAPKKLTQLIDEADIRPGTVVYMDYGAKEMRSRRHMRRAFATVGGRLIERRVLLTSRIVPHGEHSEASWSRQIPFFINTLLYEQS